MFDIAFSELLIIGIVALIVIGPERLPKVARTLGSWLGKLNRYVAQVKQDIDRDMQLEELRKLQNEMKATAQKYELMAEETKQKVQHEVSQADKVMQAMAATDAGAALQELENQKAEQSADAPETGSVPAVPSQTESAAHRLPDASGGGAAETASPEPEAFRSSLHEEVLPDEMAAASKHAAPEHLSGDTGSGGRKS